MASLLELRRRPFPIVPKDRSTRRWVKFSFVYSTAYPGHSDPKQGRCKEIAPDALTGILDGNFQIKVR
jgi:hypothetical protein